MVRNLEISKLNKIIHKFWKDEKRNDIYHLGVCSEVAVALKRFLQGGTICKAGLMHTYLDYKNHCCDIRGCFPKSRYPLIVPSGSYLPATTEEIAHINKLLEHDTVAHICKGFKKASKEV